ncbi:MAG: hypothetical protein QOE90_711 [Thermoplasmata archaeon]|nr:hypothetical protein [Thermoplasmata archaeon]
MLDFLRATDALRPERERFDAPDAVERRIAEAEHDAAKWRIVLQAAASWS